METVYIWAIGFLLGIKHSLDPDHIVAVTAIITRERRPLRSALTGVFWGVGHTASLLIAALLILALNLTIPQSLERIFELIVGMVMLWLGVSVVKRAVYLRLHIHGHRHGERVHLHFHTHAESGEHAEEHAHKHGRSVLVGMSHGLAGSAALMLLIVSQVNSIFTGIIYVGVFGAGTILGMLVFGGLIGIPMRISAQAPRINAFLRFGVGMLSMGMGLMIIARNWP